MQVKNNQTASALHFSYLPSFADYIINERLSEFVNIQLELSRELNVPVLKLLKELSEEELIAVSTSGAKEFLNYLAINQPQKQIDDAIEKWLTNQLPQINRNDIVAEDITLVTHVRRESLLHFLPHYCSGTQQMLELIKEIDLFLLRSQTSSMNVFINLLKQEIDEHSQFIEHVNNTSPGAVYVFDLNLFKNVYASKKVSTVIGYNEEELNNYGRNALQQLLHPDDLAVFQQHLLEIKKAGDGEIKTFNYRIKSKDGAYRWLRHYETVFKRNEHGEVIQVIGNVLNVDAEIKISDQLQNREQELLEAQRIAQLGSFSWNILDQTLSLSPQAKAILEIDEDDKDIFLNKVHPADKERVGAQLKEAFEKTGKYDCEFRYLGNTEEKIIWSKGLISYKDGKPACMNGTVMNVTERYNLVKQLKESEALYRQAEQIAGMGNWNWDLLTNKFEWTAQLYRIYGLEPGEPITFEKVISIIHPEDRNFFERDVEARFNEKFINHTFRIITKDGAVKTLKSIAQVKFNEQGKPISVFGTERDITEKQNLINQLQHSEYLYKQAQQLAHIGNWSWNVPSNIVSWSDELYRIYDVEPDTLIDFEKYKTLLHPDDRDMVIDVINKTMEDHQPFEIYHKIVIRDNSVRILQARGEVQLDKNGKVLELIGTAQDVTELHSVLEQFKESEKLYKQAQALVHLGNWVIDLKTWEFTWSEEMSRIYELEQNEIITLKDWESFIHPDEKKSVLSYLQQCIDKKQSYDKQHRIILRNGKIKMLHRKGEFIYDKNGNAIKLIGTTQDITEQNRVQEELKENQTFIRKITDATPSIISSYNINTGQCVFISEGIEKLLGYNTEDVMEKGLAFMVDLLHPDDAATMFEKNNTALQEANADATKNDKVVEFTHRMRNKKGEYRWFHTYGTIFDRNKNGQVEHVLNISLDVTNQVAAEQKIAEQELFIQQVADASPTILYLFDCTKNCIEYVNKEIYFVLGFTVEEVIEMKENVIKQLYHPEDFPLLPERAESDKKFQHRNSMIQYECRVKSKEGEWKWLLVREVIFKTNEAGNPAQILGAALDISQRKNMERSLLQNSFQLQQSNTSLEEFAYVASHDLKEPLRKISTFGDRVLNTQSDLMTEEGKVYMSKIVDASQRMQVMINDLLSISMISGDRNFQPYSLQLILEDTKQTLEYKIEQKNAIIEADPLPVANIIASQFRQLFQNLLSNSLKFIPEDRQPIIKIKSQVLLPEDVGVQGLAKATSYLKLEFSDNGIGFEEEYAGRIFQIFQRLHGRSEYEGTGIGLAICKKIVEHHGGVIYANGELNAGAVFTIIIPL